MQNIFNYAGYYYSTDFNGMTFYWGNVSTFHSRSSVAEELQFMWLSYQKRCFRDCVLENGNKWEPRLTNGVKKKFAYPLFGIEYTVKSAR